MELSNILEIIYSTLLNTSTVSGIKVTDKFSKEELVDITRSIAINLPPYPDFSIKEVEDRIFKFLKDEEEDSIKLEIKELIFKYHTETLSEKESIKLLFLLSRKHINTFNSSLTYSFDYMKKVYNSYSILDIETLIKEVKETPVMLAKTITIDSGFIRVTKDGKLIPTISTKEIIQNFKN